MDLSSFGGKKYIAYYTSVITFILLISMKYDEMSQVICPICGKFFSVRYYDPSDFEDDILLVQVRGLGRGARVTITGKSPNFTKIMLTQWTQPELRAQFMKNCS